MRLAARCSRPFTTSRTTPPNNARFVFLDPQARTIFREWDKVANDTVAILRAKVGRDPHDRELSDLLGQLSTRSDDFRQCWAAHDALALLAGWAATEPQTGSTDTAVRVGRAAWRGEGCCSPIGSNGGHTHCSCGDSCNDGCCEN